MAKKVVKTVEYLSHDEDKRINIPTAEYQAVLKPDAQKPVTMRYPRNTDLDPQLVWRGKDQQDWSDLVVNAPPLYIQEKVHPKVLIDDLLRETKQRVHESGQETPDLFADFNGIPKGADRTEFYQHDQNWSNRMILGDSLQVMASLAEREGLRGKVQCIYIDPPYGIKFNSNFQWSTTSRDVKDGNANHITREPEQVKAFRDTWRDGIHSYLTYLRDRLTVARDLLADSGSIFVQIGDENVHRVRAMMDEVFGEDNYFSTISYRTTGGFSTNGLSRIGDNILWYSKTPGQTKFHNIYVKKTPFEDSNYRLAEMPDLSYRDLSAEEQSGQAEIRPSERILRIGDLTGQGAVEESTPVTFQGVEYSPSKNTHWKANYPAGMSRILRANRAIGGGKTLSYKRYLDDYPVKPHTSTWLDTGVSGFASEKIFVVQTSSDVTQRCILMTTDPGDLVLDPTCGSGTTAYVAEQWGRRWITIDTSRVALALARARIMGARYPYFLLKDSKEGQFKEAEITAAAVSTQPVFGNVRQGFVYERVPHITLKSIANNAEIDVIWEKWQAVLEPLRESLNEITGNEWQEWEIPREAEKSWPEKTRKFHSDWWGGRVARQKEIDASISAKAEFEYLYDRPFADNKKVRVAGPFTVESVSPHRVLAVDENDELRQSPEEESQRKPFTQMILENLKAAGVQQAHKDDRISFISLAPWPGRMICAEGFFREAESDRRAAVFIGQEFGTVQRADLVEAAREAGDAGFDVLISCAFNYEAHSTEFTKLGRIPVLKARMNADLHMANDLKATGKGNLFVIFGEPDIDLITVKDARFRIKINGVDVFKPQTGEVVSDNADGIACWFVDTDYNEESFFVRQAYFLGANDPYSALKTTLKAEIDQDAWESLHSDTSRPFDRPKTGRIAVKAINHLGDEVMKVFKV